MKRSRRGFSLIEMMIASTLVCGVAIAILSLQSFVLRGQQKEWRMRKISGEAIYAMESIKSALRPASVIIEPAADGVPSGRLLAYVNVDPGDMAGRVNQAAQQTYFLYCFSRASGKLYKYSGSYPPARSLTSFYCGKPPGRSTTRETVISGFVNAIVTYSFTRGSRNSNAVNIDYSIKYNYEEFKGYTTIGVQKSL